MSSTAELTDENQFSVSTSELLEPSQTTRDSSSEEQSNLELTSSDKITDLITDLNQSSQEEPTSNAYIDSSSEQTSITTKHIGDHNKYFLIVKYFLNPINFLNFRYNHSKSGNC